MPNKHKLRVGRPVSYLAVVAGVLKWRPARVVSTADNTHAVLMTPHGVSLNGAASTAKRTHGSTAVNVWRPY